MHTMFINNNHASFHFWWKENLVKHQKVSKYYENDCRLIRICKTQWWCSFFFCFGLEIPFLGKFGPKKQNCQFYPIQDALFRGCPRMGGEYQTAPFPKICQTYPTMMKHGTVIPCLTKIQKKYESCETPLEFCWHQHFSPEIGKFCYIKKYRYRFHFDS